MELAAYTDGTLLYQRVNTLVDVPERSHTLQSAVDVLAVWGEGWKITFEPSKSERMVQGKKPLDDGLRKSKATFPSVLAEKLASNQLPPCTFSITKCVQGRAFTPVKRYRLQDFTHKMGVGVCPRMGLHPELYGTCRFLIKFC